MSTKGTNFKELSTAFKHKNFKPLYFLFGKERFLMQELQQLLLDHALEPHEKDFNLDIIYGPESEATAVLNVCTSFPVMAQRRVVIVRDFDQLKDNRRFTSYAENPNETAIVLLACSVKPNLSSHPYRALKQHATWAELKPPYANQMAGWIKSYAEQKGLNITPEGLQMLSEFVGTDLQVAATEINKLVAFAGKRTKLTGDDVLFASGQTRDFNVFELQRAIGTARFESAIRISERLLQQASNKRGEALMIVSVLVSYFSKLWKLSVLKRRGTPEKAMASRVGISPYFLKEYLQSLNQYSNETIERAYSALLAADFELKGGSSRDEHLILTLMMRRILPSVYSH